MSDSRGAKILTFQAKCILPLTRKTIVVITSSFQICGYIQKKEQKKVFISSSFYVVFSNHDYLQNSSQVALSPRSEVFLALSSEQAPQFWVGTCQMHPIVQLFSQCGPQNSSSHRELV